MREIGRRAALKLGAAATVGGVSLAAGTPFIEFALAVENGAPLKVKIANTAGRTTHVLQTLLAQKGYFQKFGLTPELLNVSDGSKVTGALIGGDVDVCMISGFSSLLPAIERGAKLKVLCGSGTLVGQALFSKRSDVRELKDLVGKTVGIGAVGALLHEITVAMLRKHGIDDSKVRFANIGSSTNVYKAVVAGTVDAGSAEIDNMASAEKHGVHVLTDGKAWEQIPEYTWQAAYTTDRAITEKREALVRTLATFGTLYRYLTSGNSFDDYNNAREIAFGKDKNSIDEAKLFWNFVQKYKGYAYNLVLTPEQIDYVQKLNISLGVQKKMLPFDQVTDMSIARDALKLMG